ncbi:MAG: DUF1475 family protein [Candidatus Omnitrophica bacterium]|nr:DUF1475 family protein [Candidatus Omnitrophota bacterium]MCB9720051.1 DUF1475 family protein [Candidatus Omnitrophota bacterium]
MSKRTTLIIFFSAICIAQTWLVIDTAGKSNMFALNITEPWFKTLLIDFYFNTIILSAWVIYKERSLAARILWVAAFWLTGATATALYVVVQLVRLRPGDSWDKVLVREPAGNHKGRTPCDVT